MTEAKKRYYKKIDKHFIESMKNLKKKINKEVLLRSNLTPKS